MILRKPRAKALWTKLPGAKIFHGDKLPKKKGVTVAAQPTHRTPRRHPRALWTKGKKQKQITGQHTAEEKRLYRKEAREFVTFAILESGLCPVVSVIQELRNGRKYGHQISDRLNEVHHKNGRAGSLLRDQRYWMAISKQGHRWVHQHILEARKHGWICEAGKWNKP